MDDADEDDSTGLSGYAWYQLGRSEGEAGQNEQRLFDALTGRSPVPRADYDAAIEANRAFATENERLRAEIAKGTQWLFEWRRDFARLKALNDAQAAQLAEATAKSNEQAEHLKRMFDWLDEKATKISNLEEAYFEATGESPPNWVNETDE